MSVSILGEDAQSIFSAVILIALPIASLPLAVMLGVWRPRAVVGPDRLAPDRPVFPLVIALLIGFCAMFFVGGLYAGWKHIGTTLPNGVVVIPDIADSAFLYSGPPLAGAAMLLLADWLIGGSVLIRRLGLDPARIGPGIKAGLLAAMIVIPPTYVVSMITESVYKSVQFQHPGEHELLKMLTAPEPHAVAHFILILSATMIAPFSEELMFRGHLQTLIRWVLVTVSSPQNAKGGMGFPVLRREEPFNTIISPPAPPPPATNATVVDPQAGASSIPLAKVVSSRRMVWQTWVAILFTSVLFASMHDRWMWPPIFCLSIGLGYCYERTGNIWANMTVHLLFNSLSTFVFLNSAHS